MNANVKAMGTRMSARSVRGRRRQKGLTLEDGGGGGGVDDDDWEDGPVIL